MGCRIGQVRRALGWGCIGAMLGLVPACTGGQTGDPGVADGTPAPGTFTSYDGPALPPPGPPPPGGGPCSSPPQTRDLADPTGFGGRLVGDGSQLLALDENHVALVHGQRGLTLVATDGPGLRVVARERFGGSARQAWAFGDRLAVLLEPKLFPGSASRDAMTEVALFDLATPQAPRKLGTVALRGRYAVGHLLADDASATLHIVTDLGEDDCITPTKTSWHTRVALDGEGPAASEPVELPETVLGVLSEGERMVLVHGQGASTNRSAVALQVMALRADGAPTLGSMVPLPEGSDNGGLALHLRGDTLHLVTEQDGTVRVTTYALDDALLATRQSECEVAGGGFLTEAGTVAFGRGRTFLSTWPARDGNLGPDAPLENRVAMVGVDSDGTCVVSAPETRGAARRIAIEDGARVVEVERDGERAVFVRLLDGGDGHVMAETGAALVTDASDADLATQGSQIFAPGPFAPGLVSMDEGLVAIPFYTGTSSSRRASAMLLSFTADTVTPHGVLHDGMPVLARGTLSLGAGRGSLQRLDLRDLDMPKAQASLSYAPYDVGVFRVGDYAVRHRLEAGVDRAPYLDDLETLPPSLEALRTGAYQVFDPGQDPELASPLAEIAAPGYGDVTQVGDLLVTVVGSGRTDTLPVYVDVVDFSEPLAPERLGELETDSRSVWLRSRNGRFNGPTIECHDCADRSGHTLAMAIPGALLLRASVEFETDDGEFDHASSTFHVIDLRDPRAPQLAPSIAMPEEARTVTAFTEGSRLFHVYTLPVPMADPNRRMARFYATEIDLRDPAAPVVGPAVNLPGELFARAGDRLYTREVVRTDDPALPPTQSVMHRLSIEGDRATVVESQPLGAREVYGMHLDGAGHLLVDLVDPRDMAGNPWSTVLQLGIYDAMSLSPLGEAPIGAGAMRQRASAGTIAYGSYGEVWLANVTATGQVEVRHLFTSDDRTANAQLAYGDDWLLAAGGGMLFAAP